MDKVNIVVHSPVNEASLQMISETSDRIKVDQVWPLIDAEKKGDAAAAKELNAFLSRGEILYGWARLLPERVLARAPGLKWIQLMSAGVDELPDEIMRSPVAVTSASGLHGVPIGEFVLEIMLMFVKKAPLCFRMKQEKQFQGFRPGLLRGQTMGVVGLGHIGREVARLAKAFGMRVIATRRSGAQGARARHVDILVPPERLQVLLKESDFVVLALPLTAQTRGLIGEQELRAMKPEAYLINVARGAVVDEDALIRALEQNRIAGAGLDVFSTEPLPPDSRLWELPNVIFSPHVSGIMPGYLVRATELFCDNLKRYLSGRRLRHLVVKARGY
jgi:D-2-hydroxyacid dehydrogenase (NADP+)